MVNCGPLDILRVDICHLGSGVRISEWTFALIDLTTSVGGSEGGITVESIGAVAGVESVPSGQVLVKSRDDDW